MPVTAKLSPLFDEKFDRLEARMATFEARIIRWMFLFWVGTLGSLIALTKL